MTGLGALVRRNMKLYYQDKGLFLTSLITPVILLVLFVTFLSGVYENVYRDAIAQIGIPITDEAIRACVGGQLVSSLLAVSCVTVSFCSNLTSIQDKISGARQDLTITPVKPGALALSYFLATLLSSLAVCLSGLLICLGYLAVTGWYLSAADVAGLVGDVVLLVLFGTALSACITFPLSTQGQSSAVGTIVSSGYGFLCGAYMPIAQFSSGLRAFISHLPGTCGTVLTRQHALGGALAELERQGLPAQAVEAIADSVDCRIFFGDKAVSTPVLHLILLGTILVLLGIYVCLNVFTLRKKAAR